MRIGSSDICIKLIMQREQCQRTKLSELHHCVQWRLQRPAARRRIASSRWCCGDEWRGLFDDVDLVGGSGDDQFSVRQ